MCFVIKTVITKIIFVDSVFVVGDGDQDSRQRGRTWTVRCSEPIRYRRFSDRDANGSNKIYFLINYDKNNEILHDNILNLFASSKHMERPNGGSYRTRLTFKKDRIRGEVWQLPDNEAGRHAAAYIDDQLSLLVEAMEQKKDRPR